MDKPATQKRPRGRPPQPEGVRRRSNLTLRVRDETKAALERNAAANGRSLSEEAETLLDQALRSPQMLEQAFDLALDRPGAGLIMALVRVMRDVPRGAAFVTTNRHGGDDWINSPYAFEQVSRAIAAMLEAVRPEGDVTPPPPPDWAPPGPVTAEKLRTWGDYGAQQILAAVVGRTANYKSQAGDWAGSEQDDPSIQWVFPVRERLGAMVIERIKERIAASKDSQHG
jgi:plasmid stability protein